MLHMWMTSSTLYLSPSTSSYKEWGNLIHICFPRAQHKDPLGGSQYVYHRIRSHLFHSFFPNSNGDHFNLKNCNARYLQKVRSSFHEYYVCPQNHLLCEFCKAVFLAFFSPGPMKIASNGRKCSYMQYSTLERHRLLSTIS